MSNDDKPILKLGDIVYVKKIRRYGMPDVPDSQALATKIETGGILYSAKPIIDSYKGGNFHKVPVDFLAPTTTLTTARKQCKTEMDRPGLLSPNPFKIATLPQQHSEVKCTKQDFSGESHIEILKANHERRNNSVKARWINEYIV